MNPLKTETDMFFARLASAIRKEEAEYEAMNTIVKTADRIADALAGSTADERKAKNEEWNTKADALEAKLRAEICRRSNPNH